MRILVVAALVAPSLARAETSIAVATNPPVRWLNDSGFAASAYVGFAGHHAIRVNVASFTWWPLTNLLSEDTYDYGHTRDIGIGYQFYPQRLWRGLHAEIGVLVREKQRYLNSEDYVSDDDTESTNVGGRVLLGWSWRISAHAFVATALGFSVTRATGTRVRYFDDYPTPPPMRTSFTRFEAEPELYIRIGLALGG